MIKPGEAYFIGHCENPDCDLGAFEYKCPKCYKNIVDYEIWWKEDDIWKGDKVSFKCPECGEELFVVWDMDNHTYKVIPIKA